MTGANIGDDPRFLHKTTSDVDIIDLPGFSDEDIDKMSQDEVEEHFNKPPLKGIDISDHLTKSQRTQMQRFLLKNRDMFAIDPERPGQVAGHCVRVEKLQYATRPRFVDFYIGSFLDGRPVQVW